MMKEVKDHSLCAL